MNFLAIDTALGSCSIGLMRSGQIVFDQSNFLSRGQDQELPLLVEKAFDDSEITLNDLDGIIVTQGPGSFTGIRVGLAFAKGLSSTLNIPLIGCTTIEILAQQSSFSDCVVVVEIKKDTYVFQIFSDGKADTALLSGDKNDIEKNVKEYSVSDIVTH